MAFKRHNGHLTLLLRLEFIVIFFFPDHPSSNPQKALTCDLAQSQSCLHGCKSAPVTMNALRRKAPRDRLQADNEIICKVKPVQRLTCWRKEQHIAQLQVPLAHNMLPTHFTVAHLARFIIRLLLYFSTQLVLKRLGNNSQSTPARDYAWHGRNIYSSLTGRFGQDAKLTICTSDSNQ